MDRIVKLALIAMLAFGGLSVLYVIAPILIPFILVVGALGAFTWVVVAIARIIERQRDSASRRD